MSNQYGEHARRARLKLGKSLREVAKELGVSHTYLRDVEIGQRLPPINNRIEVHARVLGEDPRRMIRLGLLARRSVRLTLEDGHSTKKNELAVILGDQWDQLTEIDAERLITVLDKQW